MADARNLVLLAILSLAGCLRNHSSGVAAIPPAPFSPGKGPAQQLNPSRSPSSAPAPQLNPSRSPSLAPAQQLNPSRSPSLAPAPQLSPKSLSAPIPGLGPKPASQTSNCSLPDGRVIDAPEQAPTAAQIVTYYSTYSWNSYSSNYTQTSTTLNTSGFSTPGQRQCPTAGGCAPPCCPTVAVKPGDTVSSLIDAAGLPPDSRVFFYAINPSVPNNTESLQAGTSVTTPCYRITEYQRLQASPPSAAAPRLVPSAG